MLNLTKRQMKAIANFCLNAYGQGAAFFGNRIEASDGKVAIRVQLRSNGSEEEQVNIPRIALIRLTNLARTSSLIPMISMTVL